MHSKQNWEGPESADQRKVENSVRLALPENSGSVRKTSPNAQTQGPSNVMAACRTDAGSCVLTALLDRCSIGPSKAKGDRDWET